MNVKILTKLDKKYRKQAESLNSVSSACGMNLHITLQNGLTLESFQISQDKSLSNSYKKDKLGESEMNFTFFNQKYNEQQIVNTVKYESELSKVLE